MSVDTMFELCVTVRVDSVPEAAGDAGRGESSTNGMEWYSSASSKVPGSRGLMLVCCTSDMDISAHVGRGVGWGADAPAVEDEAPSAWDGLVVAFPIAKELIWAGTESRESIWIAPVAGELIRDISPETGRMMEVACPMSPTRGREVVVGVVGPASG
jgi:hypothetical protein